MAYIQSNNPFKKADVRRTIGRGKNFNPVSKDKSATGAAAGGGITKKEMETLLAKVGNSGPVQTIRVEQAPLKITTDTKPQEPYKM